ncbi:hypothetical protein [Streptomyces sp. 6N223]|uniref:hypothetical protein n=1 Tax=Streptomyces sp. 6N223 TaxID=3457412 RepID=UPI003FD4909B
MSGAQIRPRVGMSAADQIAVRRQNLSLVLTYPRDHGPRSRARLAVETGLNKATVSSLVAELPGAVLRGLEKKDIRTVGMTIAVPGLVESATGVVRVAPNLGWRDIAVVDEIAASWESLVPDPAGQRGQPRRAGRDAGDGSREGLRPGPGHRARRRRLEVLYALPSESLLRAYAPPAAATGQASARAPKDHPHHHYGDGT